MALSVEIVPALAIGLAAFGAGELILHTKKVQDNVNNGRNFYEELAEAKAKNKQILDMAPKIEDQKMQETIKEIYRTVNKMISTVEKEPKKEKNLSNFFNYYLPVTLNILSKYDEIENQQLSSKEGQKFMKQTESMIEKINSAFKNQLSNLYQSDMIDTDAEMKVFETMLKADGYDTDSDFKKGSEDK